MDQIDFFENYKCKQKYLKLFNCVQIIYIKNDYLKQYLLTNYCC